MSIKKYFKSIIISAVVIGPLSVIFLNPELVSSPGFSKIFLIDSLGLQFFFIFTMIWLGAIIGIFFGYLLAPLFLYTHKLVIGQEMIYGIQELRDPSPDKFKGVFKGFFPALMALNFAIIFSSYTAVKNLIFSSNVEQDDPVTIILGVMILLALTSGIALALFSPVWFLLDSGIIYSNQKKLEKQKIPIEIRSVGGWYLYLLKGYAGISVIFYFYSIVSAYYSVESGNFAGIIIFTALPFILALFMIPSVILFDMASEHRKKYILKFATKYGIINNVQVKFEVIEK
jgi:hypothetical protein